MTQATLNHILEQVETLNQVELRRLNEVVQEKLTPQEDPQKIAVFHQALLDAGLVTEIKDPKLRNTAERKLIEIKGKPLSETIIEERR